MTDIVVKDDGGNEMILYEYNGYRYPNYPTRVFQDVPSFQFLPDDVLVVAFPRSGTHWLWETARLLVAGVLDESDVSKGVGMLEVATEEMRTLLSSPRILNTHLLYRNLPKSFDKVKPKVIYITRNPKDATVSYYSFIRKLEQFYHYTGEWNDYFRPAILGKFDYGSWFDYIKDWEEVFKTHPDLPVLRINYEEMKEDPTAGTSRLSKFLGLDRDKDFIEKVVERCSLSSLKNIKQNFGQPYRKGEVGDWKNWFTVAQNEWFDTLYQEKMADLPLKFKFTLEDK